MKFRNHIDLEDSVWIEAIEALGYDVLSSDKGRLVRPYTDEAKRDRPITAALRTNGTVEKTYSGDTLRDVFGQILAGIPEVERGPVIAALGARIKELTDRAKSFGDVLFSVVKPSRKP